ncbi:MAG: thioesterase domain-containing protein, partial [Sciscionella sp.]
DTRPLFLFHPAGGPTGVYLPLLSRIPECPPCYGFERIDELTDVEGKAARYIELLRKVQPAGPYRLAGWSFGGLLAYEVAQQLTAAGEPVDLVAMIDSVIPLPSPDLPREEIVLGRYRRFVEHVESSYGTALDVPWKELALMGESEQFRALMDIVGADAGMGEAVLRHQETSYVDATVSERYRPLPYGGRVVLYRATDPHPLTTTLDPRYLRTDDALGWDEFCTDLTVLRIPGDHISVIDPPHVDRIATHLAALLAGRH